MESDEFCFEFSKFMHFLIDTEISGRDTNQPFEDRENINDATATMPYNIYPPYKLMNYTHSY